MRRRLPQKTDLLFQCMVPVASRSLPDLRDQKHGVAQQRLLQRAISCALAAHDFEPHRMESRPA